MKEENHKFVHWYNSLEGFQRRFVARQILFACTISRPTLSRWVEGDSTIKNPHRVIINMIANQELFETKKIIGVSL